MKTANQIVSEIVARDRTGSVAELMASINQALAATGDTRVRAIEEVDRQTRINPDCNNAGNIEARIQYRVNHGDGTYSDPWWTDWKCL